MRNTVKSVDMTLGQKLWQINWTMVLLICSITGVGLAMLYSAASGSLWPWAGPQALRFAVGLSLMFTVALCDLRFWYRYAYAVYGFALTLLLAVEIAGDIGMGAQRWLDLGLFRLQPSELMKVALVLALARYLHGLTHEEVVRPRHVVLPLLMAAMPVGLVLRQPDLGTAVMLLSGTLAILFVAGVRLWKFVALGTASLAALPVMWAAMHDYQRQRVLTFLDPERDPLGSGYHILQSKIALGSGGLLGRGFMQGTQSHLNFLPEKQTDFIFTMLAEEFGLVGGLALIGLFALLIVYGYAIALRSRSTFGRLTAMGVTTTFFLYVFVNIAMVMGVIPVVGVPLPLVSYGGTALLTVLVCFGLLMNVYIHRDLRFGRHGTDSAG